MNKPSKCITPKRDREVYRLTATDVRKLIALVDEANSILTYYMVMPENKTGELEATDNHLMDRLYETVEDLKTTVGDISLF